MQITIAQVEIEQAIRDYVGHQMKIADGMEMTIDLAATRGAEGFKATIDIRPISNPAPKAPFVPEVSPVVKHPIVSPGPVFLTTGRTFEPEVVQHTQEEAPAIVQEASPFDEPTPQIQEATPAASEAVASESAPVSKGRSLFGGLNKPKNS